MTNLRFHDCISCGVRSHVFVKH